MLAVFAMDRGDVNMLKIKTRRTHSGPVVTVGLPVYNGEQYLAGAIESVLKQDFQDFKLIISDNGSDDRTPDICRHYQEIDDRIKYYRYSKNLGGAKNYTRVLRASTGKYFICVADDDLRERTMITDCLSVMEKDPSVAVCYPQTTNIDEDGKILGLEQNDYVKVDQETPKERFLSVLWNLDRCNVFYGLIRTDALHQVRLPSGRCQGSDHVMLGQLALLGKFIQIPKPLFIRRHYPRKQKFASLEEYNRSRLRACLESGSEGITLPFCEFAFETLNLVKFADLNEDDRAELIEETLRCFRTRWGKHVAYEIQRAVTLIHSGEFRKSWDDSPAVKGHKITEQFYISTILARLEMASFILPGFTGLQSARAICLQRLGRLDEARAIAATEPEQERDPQMLTKKENGGLVTA